MASQDVALSFANYLHEILIVLQVMLYICIALLIKDSGCDILVA